MRFIMALILLILVLGSSTQQDAEEGKAAN